MWGRAWNVWSWFCDKVLFAISSLAINSLTRASDPEVINFFSYSTQLSTKFILLIMLKRQQLLAFQIVGILTFISMIHRCLRDFNQETSLVDGNLVDVMNTFPGHLKLLIFANNIKRGV